jgi:dihydrofolate synthase / folylpolyglutamate synthase
MNYAELQSFLDTNWLKTSLGRTVGFYPFDRLRALLARLGSPELDGEFIGVTGSKGKGSTALLTTEILRAHGLQVGLFTSPHLIRIEERVRLDGRQLGPEEFAARFSQVLAEQQAAGLTDIGITPVLLGLALCWFRQARADAVVLEVRAGGRFDPTRVARSGTVCFGPIGLEHVPGLGHTLADVAWQKVGLLRPGAAGFSAAQPSAAERVLRVEAAAVGATMHRFGETFGASVESRDEGGQRIALRTPGGTFTGLPLRLLGAHQAENAGLAAAAAEAVLARRGCALDRAALASALGQARWPARLERLSDTPLVVYDGAHTPESAAALAAALAGHFPDRLWRFVLGLLTGKDALGILMPLRDLAEQICFVPIPGFRYQDPLKLVALARSLGLPAAAVPDLTSALSRLDDGTSPICVSGTLYLYGSTRQALGLGDSLA